MIFERTPAGTLVLRASRERRIGYAAILLMVVAVLAAQAWLWLSDFETLHAGAVARVGAVTLVLFVLIGGATFVRNLAAEVYTLDSRRRAVLRNGKRLCGYDDVLELRVVVWTYNGGIGRPDAHEFRLQLLLRGNRGGRWLGGKLNGFDQTDASEVAQLIAAEIGTSVKFVA